MTVTVLLDTEQNVNRDHQKGERNEIRSKFLDLWIAVQKF